jgi:hypothetical protein
MPRFFKKCGAAAVVVVVVAIWGFESEDLPLNGLCTFKSF